MDANAAKGLENLSPQQKEELMRTVQTQVALANMQELLTVSELHTKIRVTSSKIVVLTTI